MTNSPIEPLDLLDTDYADILGNSSNSSLELRLVRLGIDSAQARTLIDFIALARGRSDTPESWATLTEAWEANAESMPSLEHLQLLLQLLWQNQTKER